MALKTNRCRTTGLDSRSHHNAATQSTDDVAALVRDLAADDKVDGILVQHPMPAQIDERAVFEAITPSKDVDGVTMASFATMVLGGTGFHFCTPAGIIHLLDADDVDPTGLHAVVIGRSPILGKPIGMLLLARNATVTYCHSRTIDLPRIVADADIVIAAVARPAVINGAWIKPAAVVIDAGYKPGDIGDVEYAPASDRVRLITPVPGGVGPTKRSPSCYAKPSQQRDDRPRHARLKRPTPAPEQDGGSTQPHALDRALSRQPPRLTEEVAAPT